MSTGILIFLVLLAVSPTTTAHAAGRPPPTPVAHQIDWRHPQRDPLHQSGSGLAMVAGAASQEGLQPTAKFPSACYNGYYYYVLAPGQASDHSWSHQLGNQLAKVWYEWCPRWAGDRIGLNWSFGKIYQLSGCASIPVGGDTIFDFYGAYMLYQAEPPNYVQTDGEPPKTYDTCAGHLVWDYSLTLPGDGLYKVGMASDQVGVLSPCYC